MTVTDTRPLPPVPTFPFSMFDPVHLGIDENGEPVYVNLAERNITCCSAASPAAAYPPGRRSPVNASLPSSCRGAVLASTRRAVQVASRGLGAHCPRGQWRPGS